MTSRASSSAISVGPLSDSRIPATPSTAIVSRCSGYHRIHRRRQCFLVDAALNVRDQGAFHLADEFEPLVLPDDARHRMIDEHQREVLRMVAAEVVQVLKEDWIRSNGSSGWSLSE